MLKEMRQCSSVKWPEESIGQQLYSYQKVPGLQSSNLQRKRGSFMSVHSRYDVSLKITLDRLLFSIMPLFLTVCKKEIRLQLLFKDWWSLISQCLDDHGVENYRSSEPNIYLIFQKQGDRSSLVRAKSWNIHPLYAGFEGTQNYFSSYVQTEMCKISEDNLPRQII